jgi:hypothetical protein
VGAKERGSLRREGERERERERDAAEGENVGGTLAAVKQFQLKLMRIPEM